MGLVTLTSAERRASPPDSWPVSIGTGWWSGPSSQSESVQAHVFLDHLADDVTEPQKGLETVLVARDLSEVPTFHSVYCAGPNGGPKIHVYWSL